MADITKPLSAVPTDALLLAFLEAEGVRFMSFPHARNSESVFTTTGSQSATAIAAGMRKAIAALAPDAVAPKFPTAMRKMWTGGEVQAWIDANWPKGGAA